VALPNTCLGHEWTKPELRLGIDTEADDLPEVHDAASAERGENGIVERSARCRVGTLNRKVIEHGYIFGENTVVQ
jgi:hypothetical protein